MILAKSDDAAVAIARVGTRRLIIVLHSSLPAPSNVVEAASQALEAEIPSNQRTNILVLTDGGAPSIVDRPKLIRKLARFAYPPRIAVISGSASTRFVVSALALAYKSVQAFTLKEYERGLQFLDIRTNDYNDILQSVGVDFLYHQRFTAGRHVLSCINDVRTENAGTVL